MEVKSIMVSVYKSCSISRTPLYEVNIWDWLLKNPPELTQIVDEIRSTTDKDKIKKLKSNALFVASISGTFTERKLEGLKQHSGLICIDIDGKDNLEITDINEFKSRLQNLDYIMYCGLSVSGNGLFCIVKISDTENHKGHFYALQEDFKHMGIIIDKGCSDITRARIYSYDNNAYCNQDSAIYCKVSDRIGSCEVKKESCNHLSQQKMNSTTESTPISNNKLLSFDEMCESLLRPSNFDNIQIPIKPNKKKITEVLDQVNIKEIDITNKAHDWFIIGCIINNIFGEQGRELFHQISRFYDGYTFKETNTKFSSIIARPYHYKTDRIVEIAAIYGIFI